ncbi:MAG: hypothetical protein JWN00_4174 [Actinomycetia bacterium]|nr:hypothetical protein [Actinomycetes bacterium]
MMGLRRDPCLPWRAPSGEDTCPFVRIDWPIAGRWRLSVKEVECG